MTGEPRETGDLFHGLRETDIVAPRTVEAERRHSHEHGARIDLAEVVTREPEALEHARRKILDDHVGSADEIAHHPLPIWLGEIQREVALVDVGAQIGRAPFPPLPAWMHEEARHADAVGTLDRLEMDHIGTEARKHAGGRRSG